MLLASSISYELNLILGVCGVILILGLILKQIHQPYIVAYILTGIILGPSGFELVEDHETVEIIGELGLVILMFFIGMEISLQDFIRKWRTALYGTGLQVLISILLILAIGLYADWPYKRIILLGFIVSLSSSAVVIKLIEDHKLENKRIGLDVISILLTQDVLIVPMIIVMSFLGGDSMNTREIALQALGGIIIVALLIFLLRKKTMRIPFEKALEKDHEIQVFASLIICFGLALFTSSFELSAGLGAFIAGLFVNASPVNKWLHDSLHSFRIILISIFFLSIGMLIDITFFTENWLVIVAVVFGVYLSNHGINAISLRVLGNPWKHSLLGGSLLAQVGEFSFVLASLGYHLNIITLFTYNLTVIVISITILISPFWVIITRRTLGLSKEI